MKKIVVSILFFLCVLIGTFNSPFIMEAHAGGISFSGSGNKIEISGGNFPSMSEEVDAVEIVKEPFEKYKSIAVAITGFATVTAFLSMIFSMAKLSTAGDNEMARKKAIMGILTSGIGVAILGSSTMIIAFFWDLFSSSNTSSG